MFNKRKKQKENLETVQYFYELLRARIANKDILEYMMEQIKNGADNDRIKLHNDNEIIIRDDNFKNFFFRLHVGESTIDIEEIKWEGRATVTKKIEFDGEKVIVTSIEHDRITKDDVYSRFERKKTIETYSNNELCHKRVIVSSTSAEGMSNYATDTETYILPDRSAVERHISISEDETSPESTHIRYSKTNFYDVPPYDTSKQTHTVYIYGMGTATQEEFEEYKELVTKRHTLKKA